MQLNAVSMSLTGAFVLTNLYTNTVLDLSGSNQVTISGWASNGGSNQQWTFAESGPYYTIRNVAYTDKYVGYDSQAQQTKTNQPVIGVTSPILWALNQTNNDPPRFQFIVPDPDNSGLVLDLYGGYSKDGTLVQLYPNHGGDNQIWKVEPVSGSEQIDKIGGSFAIENTPILWPPVDQLTGVESLILSEMAPAVQKMIAGARPFLSLGPANGR